MSHKWWNVFLDTEIFKGPHFSTLKILNSQSHCKPTETFQCTHFSSWRSTKSFKNQLSKENFDKHKQDLQQRLCNRGYPMTLVHKILSEVQFSITTKTLHNKTKKVKEILPFVTTYNTAISNLKKVLMKNWHTIQQQPRLTHIFYPATNFILQEGKITQGHFNPRKTSFNHGAIIKTSKQRSTFKQLVSNPEGNLHYDCFLLATCLADRNSTKPTKLAPYHSFIFTLNLFSWSFIANVEAEDL